MKRTRTPNATKIADGVVAYNGLHTMAPVLVRRVDVVEAGRTVKVTFSIGENEQNPTTFVVVMTVAEAIAAHFVERV